MPFVVPEFNLFCNISSIAVGVPFGIPTPPYRLTHQECQLTYGLRVSMGVQGALSGEGYPTLLMCLQLPALTDIRGLQDSIKTDMVECPEGSGRWYMVYSVDDIGKGFENEHRTALMEAPPGSWTAPYP